jgi:hypothetical protein
MTKHSLRTLTRGMKMAARLKPRHQDEIRTKIQTSQLVNVLENHALGLSEELSNSRMKAIEILLNKTLPNLQSTELVGDEVNPLRVVTKVELVPLDGLSTDSNTA